MLLVCVGVVLANNELKGSEILSFGEFVGGVSPQHAQTKAQKYIEQKRIEYNAAFSAWSKADDLAKELNKKAAAAIQSRQNPTFTHALTKSAADAERDRDAALNLLAQARQRWDDAYLNAHRWTSADWTRVEAADKARINTNKSPKQRELERIDREIEGHTTSRQSQQNILISLNQKYSSLVDQRNLLTARPEYQQLIKKFGFNPIDPANLSRRPWNFNQDRDMTKAQSLTAGTLVSIGYQVTELYSTIQAVGRSIDEYNRLILNLNKNRQRVQNSRL